VAPTLSADGWAFTGTEWLNSSIVPVSTGTLAIRFTEFSRSVGPFYIAGVNYIDNYVGIASSNATTLSIFNGATLTNTTSSVTSGTVVATTADRYIDAVDVGNMAGWDLADGIGGRTIYIGGLSAGGIAFRATVTICAFAYYATTLSAVDVATLTTRMAAL
jgi:hypothetical protein